MIIPTCEEILNLSRQYDIIPICREVYADIVTPITLLRRIAGRSRRFYLLESNGRAIPSWDMTLSCG